MKQTPFNHFFKDPIKTAALLMAVLWLFAFLSLSLGSVTISLGDVFRVIAGKEPAGGDISPTVTINIVRHVRIPRTLACLLAGSALAVAGAILQTVLANPLASPNIIGVNSGAGLAVVICSALAPGNVKMIPLAAFAGAMAGVSLINLIGEKTGASRLTIILAGIAVSQLFNAAIDALMVLVPESLNSYADFKVGGFSAASLAKIYPAGMVMLAAFAGALILSRDMDILQYGEDTAGTLGANVKLVRICLLTCAAALAGAAISFAGLIGFVGLIVPRIVRMICTEDSFWLMIHSAIFGAALVTVCDLAARMLFAPFELPVGIILAFIGAPFFVWLLIRQRGGRMHD